MRKLSRYLEASVVVVVVLLVSCGPLTMNKIEFVERGMSSNRLSSMVKGKPFKVFTVVDPEGGLEYEAHMFYMQTGTKTHYDPGNKYISGRWETSAVSESFAFLFFEDSLLFWGFLHEFARSDDELMRRLAPMIVANAKTPIKEETVNETD
jgi:hypothetical protein